ncbi:MULTISPECIES: hypothetical protein [Vibrio]|uniref:hypothetical protein n=1 Tax=Vibrio TaxID=662 RepID=UPI000EFCB1F1|nr:MULTISPECIES: hypothetical protein [Vibrio]MDN3628639.1 hypothetical protein [Vibrio lentus]
MFVKRICSHLKEAIIHIPKCSLDGFLIAALPFLFLSNRSIERWTLSVKSWFTSVEHQVAPIPNLSEVFLSQVVDFRLAVLFCLVFGITPLLLYPISFLMQSKRWIKRKIRRRLTHDTFQNALVIRGAMAQKCVEKSTLELLRYAILTINHTFVGFLQVIAGVYMFKFIKQFEFVCSSVGLNQSTYAFIWSLVFVLIAASSKAITLSNEKIKFHKFKSLENQ